MVREAKRSGLAIRGLLIFLIVLALLVFLGWRVFVGPAAVVPSDFDAVDPELAEKIRETASGVNMRRGLKEPRFTLGKIYESNKQYGLARETYQQVIETGHGDADVWYRYAYTLAWDGQLDDAIESIDRSIRKDDTRAYTHFRRALWLQDMGRTEEAGESIERARELDPRDAAVDFAQARYLLATGDPQAALELIEIKGLTEPGIGADRGHALAGYGRALRADALRRLGRFEEARAALAGAGETTPSYHDETTIDLMQYRAGIMYDFSRATTRLDRGDYDGAREVLLTMIDRVPEEEYRVHRMLGICELSTGNGDRGLELLEQALERGDNYDTRSALARALLAVSRDARRLERDALPHARRAVEHRPEFAQSHETLGLILMRLESYAEAIKAFNRAHELDARTTLPLEMAGYCLLELGRTEDAMGRFDRAASIEPGRGDPHVGRANALLATGRVQEADRALADAASRTITDRARFEATGARVDQALREQSGGRDENENR